MVSKYPPWFGNRNSRFLKHLSKHCFPLDVTDRLWRIEFFTAQNFFIRPQPSPKRLGNDTALLMAEHGAFSPFIIKREPIPVQYRQLVNSRHDLFKTVLFYKFYHL